MAVKKVSSEVAFITEPRTDFTRQAKPWERNVTLGSWPASSIVLARKWVEPDEATIEVELPTDVAFAILPQRSDASVRERARYISLPTPVGQRRVFLIDQVDLQELDADHVKASIKALAPEAWLSQVPSTIAGADQTFSGSTAEAFKTMLYESTVDGYGGAHPCTETVQGVQYRALPILGPSNTAPVLEQSQLSYYGIADTSFDPEYSPSDGKHSATVGDLKAPFPAPVGDTIFSLLKQYPYQISMQDGVEGVEYRSEFEACLVPVPSPYGDGCLWWKLLFHTKASEPIWISRQAGTADGEATLHLTTGKTDAIAWIASSVEGSAGKAATASFPGKPRYAGPWASVEAKEVSEGQHLGKADAAREAAAALAGLQAVVTIDATANAGSDSIDAIKLRPGTLAGVRFGKQSFVFPINEVDYSFTTDDGWEIKAPVSVETSSIDYRYPWWQSEGSGEDPVPPEERKAGLRQLYGAGWRGSIAQDLRGEWWVLGSTGANNSVGEPVAKKIDELPAEAELIAITSAVESPSPTKNHIALFNASERALVVSTGLGRDGTTTTITPVTSEVSLDAPIVSAVDSETGRWTVVTEAGTVYKLTVSAAGEATVKKLDGAAGLFKPVDFTAGAEAEESRLLVASERYGALLGKGYQKVFELQEGEKLLANPDGEKIVTSKRLFGFNDKASTSVEAHGGAVGAWRDGRNRWRIGAFIACADGSLLQPQDWDAPKIIIAAKEGVEWRGVLTTDGVSYALAWGSEGLVRLEEEGDNWKQTVVESSPVLSLAGYPAPAENAGQTCWVTEAGELKTSGAGAVKTVEGLSFQPKRCWSSWPLATQTGNAGVILKGQIFVAGEGTDAALLTQSTLGGAWKEEKLELQSPVRAVVKPRYGSFFIMLEDGSLVDEQGHDVLQGSSAEGAKVFSIAEDEKTGCCWLATDRGGWRAAATHDSIFSKPTISQPAVGQVERLEGSWGELRAAGSGFMAGPEEAHFGHSTSTVRLVELTTTAVEAVPAGDTGCFLLLEDGSVYLQPDGSGACWLVAEPPEGWKPTHLSLACAASQRKVIAWTEDGHSELIGPVTSEDFTGFPHSGAPVIMEQLPGGLSKVKTDGNDAWALSGGKLVAFERTGGWHEEGEAHGATGLTDYSPRWPFLFQRGSEWLRWVDGQMETVQGVSGELLSRDGDRLATAGGAVDFSHCRRKWSETDSRWVDEPAMPAVVSAEPGRFLGYEARYGFLKQAGGRYSLQWTENAEPADHTQPWWPKTCSLQLVDAEAAYSTASKQGTLFWLGSEGLTNGESTLALTAEQREAVDWVKLAELACYDRLGGWGQGLLVPLVSGELAWLKKDQPLSRFSSLHVEGCLGLFGYEEREEEPLLAAHSSSVSAAWPGTGLQESPVLLTAEPRGLRGEELTPVVWGHYGLARWGSSWQATWPATAGLGAVTEARVVSSGADHWAIAACEQGAVATPTYSWNDALVSWPGEGLHFEPSGYRQPDNGQLALLRTAAGELWAFFQRDGKKMAKLGPQGVVADQASTVGVPITVATSEGLTQLTVKADGSFSSSPVDGSLPATTAYKKLQDDAAVAYDSETGGLQALVEANVAEPTLLKAAEPTETGLTAIRGEGTNNTGDWGSGPILYGEEGVVAVSLAGGKLAGESWSEKLAKLGFPTTDEAGGSEPDLG